MTDSLFIEFLYDGMESNDVIELVAEEFSRPRWEHVSVYGPREDYGVKILDLTHKGENPWLAVSLESAGADELGAITPPVPVVEMTVAASELAIDGVESGVEMVLELVEGIYGATGSPPTYVYGLDPFHAEGVGELLELPATETSLHDHRINDVSWLMLFPPAFVEEYGEATLRGAPVWKTEELEDGAIFLVAVSDPTDPNGVDYSGLRDYFGVEDPGPNI